MIAPEYFNNHIAVEGEIIVKRVPNDTGSVVVWNSTTKKLSTRTHAEIVSDLNLMTVSTNQLVTGLKSFVTSGGNYAPLNNALQIYADDGSLPAMTYSKGGAHVGQIMFNSDGFYFKNGDNNAFYNVKAGGFEKGNSDNDHVLLGGGGHKPVSDFALSSDLSNLVTTDTAQTITADKVFKKITTTDWVIPKVLAFPDASGALPNYIGFYMWNSQWQVNWRDSSNTYAHPLLDIEGISKNATFYGNTVSPKFVTPGGNSDQWNEAYSSLGNYVSLNTEQTIYERKTINKNLNTNDYINVAQHNAQFQIGKNSDSKSLEFAVLDNGTSIIQSKEVGVGYNSLILNPANNGGVAVGGLPVPGHALTINGSIYSVDGFYKQGYSNDYILLANGGHKDLSELLTTNTEQVVNKRKTFYNQRQNFDDLSLVVWGNNGSKGGIGFVKGGTDSAVLNFDTEFHFTNNTNTSYKTINVDSVKIHPNDPYAGSYINFNSGFFSNYKLKVDGTGNVAGISFTKDDGTRFFKLTTDGTVLINNHSHDGSGAKLQVSGNTSLSNRLLINGSIKHNNLGLTLANNAASGSFSSVLIKTGLTTGNMGTFTVKLYRYAHDYYEFNINNYKYNNSNYATNVTWKAGNSQDITRIEFLKDSNNILYVNIVIGLGYPRIAVTDFMAYGWDDAAFDSANWGAEFDGNTSGLINEGQAFPSDFKRDNYLATSPSLQNYVTLDTPQTIIANKNFAQTADVRFYGNEYNEVRVWRNSVNAGVGGVVSGHIYNWYNSRWKVGNARSGTVASEGYAFWFSDDEGSNYTQKVIIGTDGNIQTSQFGNSSQWNQAYNLANNAVKKSGDTMTGTLNFANNVGGVLGIMGDDDYYRIIGRTNGYDNGYLEIATADAGSEPIHVRQYAGSFTNLIRTATLLDENGNTSFPGTVYSQGFVKANSDNSLLLLGGGGHKAISDFVLSSQLGDYVTTDTAQKIDSTKTIGFQNTIYSGWDRSSVDNPQMGPFSLLNLALQGAYPLNGDDEFKNGNNNIYVYNNYGNGTVTMTREAVPDLPNRSGIQLRFNYNGNGATPGLGGFILGFNARPNAIFIQKFMAKLPVGYAFNNAENYMGNNASVNWLTSRAGTGKWETYVRAVICGTGTSFGNGGHVYVSGPDTAMEFYLAFAEIYEVNSSVFSRIKESFYAKNEAIDFTNNLDQLMKVGELSWAQRTVLERGWNSTYGDYIQLKTPGSTNNSAALLMSQAGNIYTTGGLYSSSNLVGGQIFNGGGNILYIGNGALPYINFESTNRFHFSINGSYRYWFDNNEFVSYGDLNLASSDNDLRDIIWTGPGGVEKHRIYEGSFSETLGYRKNGGTTYALLHSGNYSTYITGYQPSSEAFKNLRNTSNVGNVSESGIYRQENPLSGYNYTTTLNLNSSDGRQQLTIERSGGGMKFRGSAFGSGDQGWSDWKTVLTKEDTQSVTGLKSFDRVQGNFGSGWNLTTNKEVYGVLLEMGQGSTPGDNYGTGIGFHNATSGGVQASIIVKNNGVDGTHMAFATTQSYAAGPQVGMTLNNNGVVDFPRTLPTFQGSVLSTQAWVNETVTNYIPNYSNWSGSTYINQRKVVGELAWKNYGNGHTIFDISSGTTPWGVSKSNVDAEIPWQNSFPTLVGGNGSNTYGVRVDSARIADKVNGYDLSTFSTQTWVNTNFIPKTHPVFNITQNNINTWNNSVMPTNYVTTDTMQIISGPKEFAGSILASGGISSINGNSAEVFVGNSNTASLKDEIVNDESDYSIRLDPHHYEIDSSGNLDVDDRNRLIHIIGEEVKMAVNFKEIYPKQQIVIYNFDQKDNGMQVLIKGKNIYNIEPGCFLRLYVTKSLRVIAERQQPCEFIW